MIAAFGMDQIVSLFQSAFAQSAYPLAQSVSQFHPAYFLNTFA
jgi:hypothetical protein